MSKIIFINPPLTLKERFNDLNNVGSVTPPLNLLQLAAVTRKAGYETKILDCEALNLVYEQTVKKIKRYNSNYIAMSATTFTIDKAAKLAEMIKKENKDIIALVGGVHLTSLPRETMNKFPYFDVGVIGEGEVTLLELLRNLDVKKSLKNVKGIIYRNKKTNKLEITEKRELIKDLDALPFPAWDLLEGFPKLYNPPGFGYNSCSKNPWVPLFTSRGCPFNCIFCSKSTYRNTFRTNSAEYILNMIKSLVNRYEIKDIRFQSDLFTMDQKNLFKLCSYLQKEKLDLVWSCSSRVDMVNKELLDNMKKAGCWQIFYGIESGSQGILDFIKKGTTREQIRNSLKQTKKCRIKTKGSFMIGIPTEKKSDIIKTIKFAKSLELDDFILSMFVPLPGSPIYKKIKKYGSFDDEWKKMNLYNPIFLPRGITKSELKVYYKKALKEFYLRPSVQHQYLKLLLKNPQDIVSFLKGSTSFFKFILNTQTNKLVN